MKLLRSVLLLVLVGLVAFGTYVYLHSERSGGSGRVTVYYTKLDGATVVPWSVSLGAARDRKSIAFYTAAQAVAGPPPDVAAIRFPAGTIVHDVSVNKSLATVDLRGAVAASESSFTESGEFKALVWTLTALPGVQRVQVKIDGSKVPTLPGGHLELDEPLTRSSW